MKSESESPVFFGLVGMVRVIRVIGMVRLGG